MIWWLALGATVVFTIWLLGVLLMPWKQCYVCKGRKGFRHRKVHSHCWRCNHRGEIPRIGARLVNRLIRKREI